MEQLKPCPFCNGEANTCVEVYANRVEIEVGCKVCGLQTNHSDKQKRGLKVTAKEYLLQVQGLEKELAAKRRLLQKLRDKSVALSSPKFGDKIQSSAMDNSHIIDKIIDVEHIIQEKELELIDKISEISKSIECVCEPALIAVLTDKYINGLSLFQIAEKFGKSERAVQVWHGQALQIFRKEMNLK